jgi:hypothetical protein
MDLYSIWPIVWGGLLIVTGIYWLKKRSIGIGIEGKPALFYIKGNALIILGMLIIIVGIIILLNPQIMTFLNFKF